MGFDPATLQSPPQLKDMPPVPSSWLDSPLPLSAVESSSNSSAVSPSRRLQQRINELSEQLEQSETVTRLTAEIASLRQENTLIKRDAELLVQTAKAVEVENKHLRKSNEHFKKLLSQFQFGNVNMDSPVPEDGKDAVATQLRIRDLSLQQEVRTLRNELRCESKDLWAPERSEKSDDAAVPKHILSSHPSISKDQEPENAPDAMVRNEDDTERATTMPEENKLSPQNTAKEESSVQKQKPSVDVRILSRQSYKQYPAMRLEFKIRLEEYSTLEEGRKASSKPNAEEEYRTLQHDISPDSKPVFDAVELIRNHNLPSELGEVLASIIADHIEMLHYVIPVNYEEIQYTQQEHNSTSKQNRNKHEVAYSCQTPHGSTIQAYHNAEEGATHFSRAKIKSQRQLDQDQAEHERFVQQEKSYKTQHRRFLEERRHSEHGASLSMETSRDNFILKNRVAWSPPGYATRDLLFSEMGLAQQHNTPVVSVNMKSVPSTTKNRQSQMESERHFNALKDPRLHIPSPTLQSIKRRWKATAHTEKGQTARAFYRSQNVDGVDFDSFVVLIRQVLDLSTSALTDKQVKALHDYLQAGRDWLPPGDLLTFLRGSTLEATRF